MKLFPSCLTPIVVGGAPTSLGDSVAIWIRDNECPLLVLKRTF